MPPPINKNSYFLVVDDFESMRKVTVNQLRTLGAANIATASNGAEALRMMKLQPYDMILSDWNMPVMTGLELLKAVRADDQLSHIPFIIITAEAARTQVAEAISHGVNDLIVKPYTSMTLSNRVARALSRPQRPAAIPDNSLEAALEAALNAIAPASASSIPATKSDRASLLLVDDTPDNLHLLSHLFQDEYQVRVAHNGEKALKICQSDNPPDLVLLDIMMPDMDGFEVARRMREHPSSENIPIIFVTAMTDDDARIKGLELGAVDFVTKPIDPHILKPRVRNFLRYVELHKQLQADYDEMLEAARLREDVEQITRHDLKGPLAGIIGMVQMLMDDDSTSMKQVQQLRAVEETALQVLGMINLSSELYKVETGRFKLDAKPVNVEDILRRIVETSRTTYAEKQLTVVLDANSAGNHDVPQALGDAMFCYSIFQNLIKNACEAAPGKSSIFVRVIDATPLQIGVSNRGAVPKEIRERFFEKFVTQNKSGGTGLGTYSAKLLTEAQSGTIELTVDDANDTTTITVALPRLV